MITSEHPGKRSDQLLEIDVLRIMKARKSIFWAFTAAEVLLLALALYGYFFAIFFALGMHALADRAIEKEEAK